MKANQNEIFLVVLGFFTGVFVGMTMMGTYLTYEHAARLREVYLQMSDLADDRPRYGDER